MDYSKEVEEMLLWFALVDWWEVRKSNITDPLGESSYRNSDSLIKVRKSNFANYQASPKLGRG